MHEYLVVADEVQDALDSGQAVVALESTVISHGLPYPTNLKTARSLEAMVRLRGAVPATIAVLKGRLRVGVSQAELEYLATGKSIRKTSRRDLAAVVAMGGDGATTVAGTATIASWAGIEVFATGGIGGVHKSPSIDVSNDLSALAVVPVAVVCAGAKSILDLPATLERLETAGVPVVGYGTGTFPTFLTRSSGLGVPIRVETPHEAASIVRSGRRMGLPNGTLIVVPIPQSAALAADLVEGAVASALSAAKACGIEGNALTPFLLERVAQETQGASLEANVALLENNAGVAADIALALSEIPMP